MASMLPSGFAHLESLACDWALETENQRSTKRRTSSTEELRSFYAAVFPEIEKILTECDRFPVGQLPATHRALFSLALMCAEVAPHVELYGGDPRVPHSFEEVRFVARHGDIPTWREPAQ